VSGPSLQCPPHKDWVGTTGCRSAWRLRLRYRSSRCRPHGHTLRSLGPLATLWADGTSTDMALTCDLPFYTFPECHRRTRRYTTRRADCARPHFIPRVPESDRCPWTLGDLHGITFVHSLDWADLSCTVPHRRKQAGRRWRTYARLGSATGRTATTRHNDIRDTVWRRCVGQA